MKTKISVSDVHTRLAEVRRSLTEAAGFEDIRDLRDQAEAIRCDIKKARLGRDVQNKAAEVRLLCERRGGQFLDEHLSRGGDHKSNHRSTEGLKLSKLGIDNSLSSRWQREASVTDEEFTAYVERTCREGKELTSKGLLDFARNLAEQRRPTADDGDPFRRLADGLRSLDRQDMKFACIYADPRWYRGIKPKAKTPRLGAMLARLPVKLVAAQRAHLHLWVTPESLADGLKLLQEWGFRYHGSLVRTLVPVGYSCNWRQSHEILLLGVCGGLAFRDYNLPSWIDGHLNPPATNDREIHELIERVSPGPYLDLLGTVAFSGWTLAAPLEDRQGGEEGRPVDAGQPWTVFEDGHGENPSPHVPWSPTTPARMPALGAKTARG